VRFNGTSSDIRLVCFDWNGTLLDDWAPSYGAVGAIFSTFGLKVPTEDEYRREISGNYMQFYLNHGIPRPATEEGMVALKADLNRIRADFLDKHWESAKIAPGARQLLRRLSNQKVLTAIVSAGEPVMLQKQLVRFQVRSYFGKDMVIGGAYGKDGKFNALSGLASRFELAPESCVYVDDTYDGLLSAKQVGMKTIAILNGYNTPEAIAKAKPDFSVPTFEKVRNAFL
jgi:phosphoglycolate phosphatase